MSRPAIALILLVALAATGLIALALLDKQRDDRSEKEHASRDRFVTPVEGNGENAERERTKERERTPTAENRGWNVTGFVTSTDGTPIANATVRALDRAWARATGRRYAGVESTTGPDGAYVLDAPSPECRFDVVAEGFLPYVGTFESPSGDARDFDRWRLDFELKPAGALAGRVTDTEGQPVPTATVYVIDAQHLLLDRLGPANSVTTGLDGRYAFPGLPDGVIDLGVRVLAGGYLPALRKDVTVPEVGRSTVDFVLEHGRAVKAHLEGEWSGATVWAADSRLKGRLLPRGSSRRAAPSPRTARAA